MTGSTTNVLFGDRVVMIDKPSELLPGGAQPAPEPPPPVPTPTPTPPPAEPSSGASAAVSIEGGALFTSEPEVQLQFVAPPGTTSTQVSNDGGFVPFSTVAGTENTPWTLARSGAERLPKTVYVRFLPSGLARQDDIVLDQTAPNLIRAEARAYPASATRCGSRPRTARPAWRQRPNRGLGGGATMGRVPAAAACRAPRGQGQRPRPRPRRQLVAREEGEVRSLTLSGLTLLAFALLAGVDRRRGGAASRASSTAPRAWPRAPTEACTCRIASA